MEINQQTDGLHPTLKKTGCKYLCHVKIASLETKKKVSAENLNKIFVRHQEKGWVNEKAGVLNPNAVNSDLTSIFGGESPLKQMGSYVDGTIAFWGGKQPRAIKYIMRCYKTAHGTHWVLLDKDHNLLYDSWTRGYEKRGIVMETLIG